MIGPNAASCGWATMRSRGGRYAHFAARRHPGHRVRRNGSDLRRRRGHRAAAAKAKGADAAILVLGEHQGISGEGFDRSSLDLPGNQEALLEAVAATGTPVVLVLQNGRPLTIPWAASHMPAILEAWYPGERGGQAIAETLFGDNNPAGRLPISFPRSVGALPDFYNHDPSRNHPISTPTRRRCSRSATA